LIEHVVPPDVCDSLGYLVLDVLTSGKAKFTDQTLKNIKTCFVLLQTHLELEHPSNLDIMASPSGREDHNQNGGYISLIANNGKSITQYFSLQADKRRQATLEISFGNTTTYSRRLLRVLWKRMPVRRLRRKEEKNSKTRKSKASNLLLRRSRAPFAILRLVGFTLTYPLPWLTIGHSIAGAKFLI
jgi:hypothetical protein